MACLQIGSFFNRCQCFRPFLFSTGYLRICYTLEVGIPN